MGQLPIIPGFEVSTPIGGVQMDASAFREAALMRGKVAGAAGAAVSDLFNEVSQKISDARDSKAVYQANTAQTKTYNDFLLEISTNPELRDDPKKWMPEYQKRVDAVKAQHLDNAQVSIKTKRHLEEMFTNWSARTTLDVNFSALKREASDSAVAGKAAIISLHDSDLLPEDKPKAAMAIASDMVKNGAITAVERKVLLEQFPKDEAEHQIALINSTPDTAVNAPELIKKWLPQVSAGKRHTLENEATTAQAKQQNIHRDGILERIDNGEAVADDELKQKQEGKFISEQGTTRIRTRLKQDELHKATEQRNVLMFAASTWNWEQDETPAVTEKQMKDEAAALPEKMRKQVYDNINSRMKGLHKPAEEATTKLGQQFFTDGLFRNTTTRNITEPIPKLWWKFFAADETKVVGKKEVAPRLDRTWQSSVSKDEKFAAIQNQAKWQADMATYLQYYEEIHKGKGPSVEEIQAEGNLLIKPQAEQIVKDNLNLRSAADLDAMEWVSKHPDDPKAKAIMKKLGMAEPLPANQG